MYETVNSETRLGKRWPVAIAAGLLGAAVLCQTDIAYAFSPPHGSGFAGGGFHGGGFGGFAGGGGHGGWGGGYGHGWGGGYGYGHGGYGYGHGYGYGYGGYGDPGNSWGFVGSFPAYGSYSYSQPSTGQVWYYCAAPAGYYPYVTQCSTAWQTVPATGVVSQGGGVVVGGGSYPSGGVVVGGGSYPYGGWGHGGWGHGDGAAGGWAGGHGGAGGLAGGGFHGR
jgi:hypothetical protein